MDMTSAGPRMTFPAEFPDLPGRDGFPMALCGPSAAATADRILQTLAGSPRRAVAPTLLTAAQRRARWRRAKMMYRVMRGLTGILVRLTFYGLACRLVFAVRGGPFRRRRPVAEPIPRPRPARTPLAVTPPPANDSDVLPDFLDRSGEEPSKAYGEMLAAATTRRHLVRSA